jgi:hypothetical protein
VFTTLEELSRLCGARHGAVGAFIEDKNSGTILLQQAQRRGMRVQAIDSKLAALGKDERAINVSGYVHRGNVKYSDQAFNKIKIYKQRSRNHLVEQIESFRVGDKESDREDDLLDTRSMMLGVEWSKARLRGRPRTIRPLAGQSSLDTSSQWLRAANVMPNG